MEELGLLANELNRQVDLKEVDLIYLGQESAKLKRYAQDQAEELQKLQKTQKNNSNEVKETGEVLSALNKTIKEKKSGLSGPMKKEMTRSLARVEQTEAQLEQLKTENREIETKRLLLDDQKLAQSRILTRLRMKMKELRAESRKTQKKLDEKELKRQFYSNEMAKEQNTLVNLQEKHNRMLQMLAAQKEETITQEGRLGSLETQIQNKSKEQVRLQKQKALLLQKNSEQNVVNVETSKKIKGKFIELQELIHFNGLLVKELERFADGDAEARRVLDKREAVERLKSIMDSKQKATKALLEKSQKEKMKK